MMTREELKDKRNEGKDLMHAALYANVDPETANITMIELLRAVLVSLGAIKWELEYMNDKQDDLTDLFTKDYKDSKAGFENKVGGTD